LPAKHVAHLPAVLVIRPAVVSRVKELAALAALKLFQ